MVVDAGERADRALAAARAGAAVAERHFRTGIDVERKSGRTDVVTQADRDAQRRVIEVIREAFPDDVIVGEEEDERKTVPDEGAAWVIDPIDGTNNYVRNVPLWATSVAAVVDGEAVAGVNVVPALDDEYVSTPDGTTLNGDVASVSDREHLVEFVVVPTLWWGLDRRDAYAAAAREIVDRVGDMRRYGSAQLELSMVAAGQIEGAISDIRANPWDSVAGVHMVRQAGGTVTDVDGDPWEPGSRGLVASNGTRHDELLAATQAIESR